MAAILFTSAMVTHVGCRRRINEDSVLSDPNRGLWLVADGMGGHAAGEIASAMVVDGFATCRLPDPIPDPGAAATAVLTEVNRRILDLAAAGGQGRIIGSTVVGLLATSAGYVCFWAGDSRAYLVRSGRIDQLTRDHSLVQDLVDAGMLSAAEAASHPNANVITRAVGAAEQLKVDMVEGPVEPGDHFVLASDGLTRLVTDREIGDAIGGMEPDAAVDRLLGLALERGAPDNVSIVIVRAGPVR